MAIPVRGFWCIIVVVAAVAAFAGALLIHTDRAGAQEAYCPPSASCPVRCRLFPPTTARGRCRPTWCGSRYAEALGETGTTYRRRRALKSPSLGRRIRLVCCEAEKVSPWMRRGARELRCERLRRRQVGGTANSEISKGAARPPLPCRRDSLEDG